MKLKNLPVKDVIQDPRILMTLWNFFNYSINQVIKYEDLSEGEQNIITRSFWDKYIEEGEPNL